MRRPGQAGSGNRFVLRVIGAAFFALASAACNVTESVRIEPLEAVSATSNSSLCASDLGAYALPKAHLHVVVGQLGNDAPDIVARDVNKLAVETVRHVDPSLVFCLDYLASPMADDKVTIKKAEDVADTGAAERAGKIGTAIWRPKEKTPFLGAVSVNATDRSQYIIETLLRALFIGASGNPAFGESGRQIAFGTQNVRYLADLEYDPFDPEETAIINTRLTKLGFCLVLEGYTFARRGLSVDGYCNAPSRHNTAPNRIVGAYIKAKATHADKYLPGLLYRPRIPYRLEIYRKIDPGGAGRWLLTETLSVQLENLSPVLSLDIHRAAFAGRNANFIFDQGALMNACVSKGSEVEGFVDIPLQISRSILELPGSIVKIRIDQAENERQLIIAQTNLIKIQNAYFAALESGKYEGAPAATTPAAYQIPNFLTDGGPPIGPVAVAYSSSDAFNQDLTKLCQGGG